MVFGGSSCDLARRNSKGTLAKITAFDLQKKRVSKFQRKLLPIRSSRYIYYIMTTPLLTPSWPKEVLTKEQAQVMVANYREKGSVYQLADFFRKWQSDRDPAGNHNYRVALCKYFILKVPYYLGILDCCPIRSGEADRLQEPETQQPDTQELE